MIYFIQQGENGPIKIGKSEVPFRRLGELKIASPYPLHVIAIVKEYPLSEKDIHERFAAIRLKGEWFKPDQCLLDFIATLRIDDMMAGIVFAGERRECRICGFRFSLNDENARIKHREIHHAMAQGSLTVDMLDILESCGLALLYGTPGKLINKHKHPALKRAIAFSLWEKAKRKKIPQTAFEAFIIDHLAVIDAITEGDKMAEQQARDRVNMCWSSYKEKQ